MTKAEYVAKNIRELRKEYGYSRVKLAEILGITEATLIKYERGGITSLTLDVIEKITKCFGISCDFLFGTEGKFPDRPCTQEGYCKLFKVNGKQKSCAALYELVCNGEEQHMNTSVCKFYKPV